MPLIGAISAGNCAALKPSNHAPHTAAVMETMIREHFDEEYITVFQGGREMNQLLFGQCYDYIFFSGNPSLGKIVMEAASKHLTPVTLELGGKNPCIVEREARNVQAARRITWGKLLNARPKPLALYFFFDNSEKQRMVLESISFGTGCINDAVIQFANLNLPFGGVGQSGIGSYHGKASFETFSHRKSVMKGSRLREVRLRYPPYRGKLKWLKMMLGQAIFSDALRSCTVLRYVYSVACALAQVSGTKLQGMDSDLVHFVPAKRQRNKLAFPPRIDHVGVVRRSRLSGLAHRPDDVSPVRV
jgi:hypothetical protein